MAVGEIVGRLWIGVAVDLVQNRRHLSVFFCIDFALSISKMAFWSVLCAAVVGLAAAERCRVGQIFRPIVPADPQPDDSVQFDFGIAHIPQ